MKNFLIIFVSIAGYMILFWGYKNYISDQKPEQTIVRDTIYLDSFLIPFPVQVPIIEIPHREHGRMIVNLNDSTITLTASQITLVDFKDQDMLNKYLYQQFDGQNTNRKGE